MGTSLLRVSWSEPSANDDIEINHPPCKAIWQPGYPGTARHIHLGGKDCTEFYERLKRLG